MACKVQNIYCVALYRKSACGWVTESWIQTTSDVLGESTPTVRLWDHRGQKHLKYYYFNVPGILNIHKIALFQKSCPPRYRVCPGSETRVSLNSFIAQHAAGVNLVPDFSVESLPYPKEGWIHPT